MRDIVLKVKEEMGQVPQPDIAICSQCGWRGPISKCQTSEEGDWESGYHTEYFCPVCEDGGCIDDFDFSSEELFKKWWKCYFGEEYDK